MTTVHRTKIKKNQPGLAEWLKQEERLPNKCKALSLSSKSQCHKGKKKTKLALGTTSPRKSECSEEIQNFLFFVPQLTNLWPLKHINSLNYACHVYMQNGDNSGV
jgi:hypothetical protein